ncbi:acyl-CoA dehydrogenase family protein [Microbacterium enclense]|uniref:acyl-CoA dehydrogenase family protein n=1 Tax=Microbacterium enclense TaxID=993073 RepID=UPI003F7D717E
MTRRLTVPQQALWHELRAYGKSTIAPQATDIDRTQQIPEALIRSLGSAGWIGARLSLVHRPALDMVSYGLLSEEAGHACANVRNFIAVEDMVLDAIDRWGSVEQKARWIDEIVGGRAVASFALTEPGAGSDASAIATSARRDGDSFVLNGVKRWISFAAIADVFLVLAKVDGAHTAFLVPRESDGVRIAPIVDMAGLRGSMLAEVSFESCRVSTSQVLGPIGGGLPFVAAPALMLGRYSTAWGCVGAARLCLESALDHARSRVQFGVPLIKHGSVQRMIARMATETNAARGLCIEAGLAEETAASTGTEAVLQAKYFASLIASRSSADAVQILGARGLEADSSVARVARDAQVTEIIEGTTQVIELLISSSPLSLHPLDRM